MTDSLNSLSPAAQAVLDAFLAEWPDEALNQDRQCLAAAIRAAVEQLKRTQHVHPDSWGRTIEEVVIDADDLLDIATELEGSND